MSGFFKNKNKLTLALGAVFLAVTLFAGTLAYFSEGFPDFAPPEAAGPAEAETAPAEEETEPAPEEEEAPPEEEVEVVSFNVPSEMRGTFLVPGVDFLTTADTSEAAITKEVDAAFQSAKDLTINAVIIDTAYEDHVIYQTMGAPELSSEFDLLQYIVDRARQEGFYTYAIFDAGHYDGRSAVTPLAVGGGVDKLAANLGEFAEKYRLDGVLLDGYQNSGEEKSYGDYLSLGGGMGFGNFMRQSPAAIVKTASQAVRAASPSTQVGLLADAVWENQSQNEEGSATEAAFTSLSGGNADTKGFIEKGFVDFVAVKAYTTLESATEPFAEVAKWWGGVARQNDIPMYVVHAADKIGSGEAGWGSQDQILKQVIEAAEIGGVRGSIFNRLAPLASPATEVGGNLALIYTEEAEPEQVLTQLEMTKPLEQSFTTSDPFVTFTGASDPGEPVTINDRVVDTDQTGYFTVQAELQTGLNNFTIRHKDKQIDYAITREIDVLDSAAPMSDVTVEGGMTVTISALAYMDADVYAEVGGETVQMEPDPSLEDEESRDGFFRTFIGEYRAPAATGETQTIGGITVYASYEGEEDSIRGGTVYVNKKARLEDGVAVRVIAEQAITYPPDTSNNIPAATYYPLPQGAMDYAVGDEISYSTVNNKGQTETFTYFVLASGLRVESKDIAAISDDFPSGNVISGIDVTADNSDTYVTLTTAQQVSYSVTYSASAISFEFHNTDKVPEGLSLSKNPLFTNAGWSGSTLTLSFAQQGSFMGYKGYYDDSGNLILRFNNPPSSISAARIAIDPGHGGGDQGTSGFLADYPEKEINSRIAAYLAEELEARGATVYLMDNGGIEGPERKRKAEEWGADLFISVHSNSAPNTNATGTEVYYFHPFNYRLANQAAGYGSGALDSNNRGAKQSYYHVSLSSQFLSVLVECGFLSNRGEYEKLVSSGYQEAMAVGIADAISATVKATYNGGDYSGSQSAGSSAAPGGQSGSGNTATDLYLDDAEIGVGEVESLVVEFYPEGASSAVTWRSEDTDIATVKDGKVTGVREGEVTVTATLPSGVESECVVTVTDDGRGAADEIYLDNMEIGVGDVKSLTVELYPENSSTNTITWKSGDTKIATVKDGKVTGVKEGEVTITGTLPNGESDKCTVTVKGKGKTATDISLDDAEIGVGDVKSLTVEFYPSGSGATVTWKSSNTGIVTVKDGKVTGVKEGEAVVTGTLPNGESDKCTVTVTDNNSSSGNNSGVSLGSVDDAEFEKEEIGMKVGEAVRLKIISDEGKVIRGGDFEWSTDDRSGAITVDRYGYVKAKAAGDATVYAEGDGYELECYVEVTDDEKKVKVEDIDFERSTFELDEGDTLDLLDYLDIFPKDAEVTLVWELDDEDEDVSINQRGEITALDRGEATVRVYVEGDEDIFDECTIDVSR